MPGTYIKLPPDASGGSGFIASTTSTDSVLLTVLTSNLSADLKLSADAATAGSMLVTNTIHSGGSPGLHSEATLATALLSGFLKSADWVTFNAKEPAIVATTSADYYRGDKTFQTLNTLAVPELTNLYFTTSRARLSLSATSPIAYDNTTGVVSLGTLTLNDVTATTSGVAAAAGKIGEILTATQATNTATGVGATGVYGNVVSQSLTAGRWAVWGSAAFTDNSATLTTGLQCGISASASGAGLSEFDTALFPGLLSSTSDLILTSPQVIVDISATTTYYLNTKFYYTAGSPQHRGKITALRIG